MHGNAAHSKPLVKKYSIIFPKCIMDLENPCERYISLTIYICLLMAQILLIVRRSSQKVKYMRFLLKKYSFPKIRGNSAHYFIAQTLHSKKRRTIKIINIRQASSIERNRLIFANS